MTTFKLSLALFLLIAFSSSLLVTCEARKGRHHQWRKHRVARRGYRDQHQHHHHSSGHTVSALKSDNYITQEDTKVSTAAAKNSPIYNVLDYGAKGDGKADDTKAFAVAWAAACKVQGSTVTVPSGSVFLVKPISFAGPNCQTDIVFQLDGKIIAPTGAGAWGSGLLQWLEFTKLQRLTIRGKGVIDGQGAVWWNDSPTYNPTDETAENSTEDSTVDSYSGKMPRTKPTALRFYGSNGVTVTGITLQNSPQTHLKFDSCTNVQVSAVTVSSPGDSPNTDGIHLQNSQDVVISGASLACGDDCISIQTGCSNVYIHNVNCGPGHGVSIGGLGKDATRACVSNITVRDVKLQNTLNGVRIKTWQGGSGSVKNVMFANIQVSEVEFPIMIDQFYCDKGHCANKTSAVAVSGINYVNIQGTYTSKPAHFACSDSIPCTGVSLDTIELKSVQSGKHLYDPFCWEAYGDLKTNTLPPIDCLMKGKPSSSISSVQSAAGGYSC
ncbi:polygalacturonase At1g48100 isoform X2 [Argentina anserina]|uniref:polygalacturonase At1g48100 isoform X2 n=1 Tax=Argentina anserina TaxID=57926 RepID=UPI0021768AE9|nr:polygalacturonase At1g48100 isoform X2 [Potentilla anserina]